MASTLTPAEEAQVTQTIEMFEVITQSQPHDCQSLEILKEAYSKLGREKDAVTTSKRIAQAYVIMGQLSSAILEYETVLQRHPGDTDVEAALKEIEARANSLAVQAAAEPTTGTTRREHTTRFHKPAGPATKPMVEDGRRTMHKLFVETKTITEADFESSWPHPNLTGRPPSVVEPFIQGLANRVIMPVEKSLRVLSDRSRCACLSLNLYDVDIDLARTFPVATCLRWCVLPFDRMSKSVLVATANPFNQQAGLELGGTAGGHILWYLASPNEIMKYLRKAFR